jgi:hypothetical protein
MTKSRREIEALVDALDDVPIDAEHVREKVAELGIDVPAMAARIRAKIAAADAADRKKRFADASAEYTSAVERLASRRPEPKRERAAQEAIFKALVAKAPPQAVAMHFHRYESATEDELAEMIRVLRHLLGEDDEDEPA